MKLKALLGNRNLGQFLLFLLVGVSNTIISEGIYMVLVLFHMNYMLANIIGFIISVLNAYFWNSCFVFAENKEAEKRVWWKALGKTYMAYIGSYLLSLALLYWWVDIFLLERFLSWPVELLVQMGWENLDERTLSKLLAAAINLCLTTPINYVANKFWALKQ